MFCALTGSAARVSNAMNPVFFVLNRFKVSQYGSKLVLSKTLRGLLRWMLLNDRLVN